MRTGYWPNALVTDAGERRWFTAAAGLPVVSMDAERAARSPVGAAFRGTPEVVLTPPAKVGMRVHALAPSTTLRCAA